MQLNYLILLVTIWTGIRETWSYNEKRVTPHDGDVKLIDGLKEREGTVLVFRGYAWGSVCDDGWSLKEANVVCHQLGMDSAVKAHTQNHFKSFGLPYYLMDDVQCTGLEDRINKCRFPAWGRHNCELGEAAGVECKLKPPPVKVNPSWNLLGVQLSRSKLEKLTKVAYTLRFQRQEVNGTGLLIVNIKGNEGGICPDDFRAAEANVACRQLGRGFGQVFSEVSIDGETILSERKHLVRVGRCYGNETMLSDCVSYGSLNGVPCESEKVVAIKCTKALPDILPDFFELERSSYLSRTPLWHLECALSEKCLPENVYNIIEKNPTTYVWQERRLMRFSSIIENVGTAPFLPFEKSENWEWHACHLHYHSMKVFARYEVIDEKRRTVASGHKASFCLEDNLCMSGVTPQFSCSNRVDTRGSQGITPGCKDTYLHDYDCQWVDLTDVSSGVYTFQVILNPDFLVPELNFMNNAASCTLHYLGYQAVLRNCRQHHPYDLL